MAEMIRTTKEPEVIGESKMAVVRQEKTVIYGGVLDAIIKVMVILFLFNASLWVAVDVWYQEQEREQFCNSGPNNSHELCK